MRRGKMDSLLRAIEHRQQLWYNNNNKNNDRHFLRAHRAVVVWPISFFFSFSESKYSSLETDDISFWEKRKGKKGILLKS